jgi:DNA-binding beta-propeller fold protein YncE
MDNKKMVYVGVATIFVLFMFVLALFTTGVGAEEEYTFVTKWGSFGTGDGEFDWPSGIAVDGSGYVYVADFGNARIQKFSSDGNFITKWGVRGTGDGEFLVPYGIGIDSSGSIYVSDLGGNNRIQKFDSFGNFITKWGSFGTGDGVFAVPVGIAVDSGGNVYVAETSNNRIQKFDSSGNFITKWGLGWGVGTSFGGLELPTGMAVAVDGSGNVFVADTDNNRIQKFDSYGNFITKWGGEGTPEV